MKATILNRWTMDLPPVNPEEPWFLDWVVKDPKQAGKHLSCGYRALESLLDLYVYTHEDIDTVWHPFGGIGAQALMVEELFGPAYQLVADVSDDAVAHLKRALPRHLDVWKADAYRASVQDHIDLAVLDFGDLTVWKARPDKPHGQLLDKVFDNKPKAVVLTDIAARYLHLQKKAYEPILGPGTCDSYELYLRAFANHITLRHGYVLHEAHYTRWSAVMAFIPLDRETIHSQQILPLPATETDGLVLS